jgi:putative transposase
VTDKFQNRYRIPSSRAQWWDYGHNAAYFVTICTHNRFCYFGDIAETRFIASPLGKIVETFWYEIPRHFPFVDMDSFVVMPNHIHGIIIINKPSVPLTVETRLIAFLPSTNQSTYSPKTIGGFAGNKNPMLNDNLSRIIRWYKGRITFESHKINADFEWQSRFYEHIIRNKKSYQKISYYIIHNPAKWNDDKFHDQ